MSTRLVALSLFAVVIACSPTSGGSDGGVDGGADPNGPYTGPTTANWTKATLPASGNTNVQYLASFANHKDMTFVGWGLDFGQGYIGGGGVMVTKDDGATWQLVTLPAPNASTTQTVHSVSSVASDQTRVYVASAGSVGLLVSDDDGATWTKVPAPGGMNANGFRVRLGVVDGKLWAGRYNGGAFVSTDKGATWTTLMPDTGNPAAGTTSFAAVAGKVFVGTWNKVYHLEEPAVLRPATTGLPFPGGSNQLEGLGSKLFSISTSSSINSPGALYVADPSAATINWMAVNGVSAMRIMTRNKTALFVQTDSSTTKVALSTDSGATWLPFGQGLPMAPSSIGAGKAYLYAVVSGEIWRTPIK